MKIELEYKDSSNKVHSVKLDTTNINHVIEIIDTADIVQKVIFNESQILTLNDMKEFSLLISKINSKYRPHRVSFQDVYQELTERVKYHSYPIIKNLEFSNIDEANDYIKNVINSTHQAVKPRVDILKENPNFLFNNFNKESQYYNSKYENLTGKYKFGIHDIDEKLCAVITFLHDKNLDNVKFIREIVHDGLRGSLGYHRPTRLSKIYSYISSENFLYVYCDNGDIFGIDDVVCIDYDNNAIIYHELNEYEYSPYYILRVNEQ